MARRMLQLSLRQSIDCSDGGLAWLWVSRWLTSFWAVIWCGCSPMKWQWFVLFIFTSGGLGLSRCWGWRHLSGTASTSALLPHVVCSSHYLSPPSSFLRSVLSVSHIGVTMLYGWL